ncbi:type II secretion system protein GspM [Desulfurivibrio alkaliphilus]|uniref:General secretion pathway M protein n=1 Tax=Desulfurivibrio alkaliphilus (strain DSM 19089 / UNIQEM U267 / AHT2) TaxID=589865 RepID=D6Z6G3_DESAT|nr:type II secretion system protein GspM [Desulfurivibrio alkaliphilus]ADH86928.1 General secretion pathway M protein [Desulfurivibrio alkaliphilus AHT 2]
MIDLKEIRAGLEARLEGLLADVPPRQRPLLFIGLGLLVPLLVWLLLLAPLGSSRDSLQRDIGAREQELAWMREAAQEVQRYAITAGNGARPGGSPLAAIDSSAREFGLGRAMQRVEPGDGGEVRVWLEDAVFDDLLRWLDRLGRGHGIEAVEVVVEPARGGRAARVNARLTLIRDAEAS